MRIPSLIAAAGLVAATVSATAGPHHRRGDVYVDTPPPYVVQGRGYYCQPLCSADVTPCDPPEFKWADGRCSGLRGGRF
jgi:hypothetical protein